MKRTMIILALFAAAALLTAPAEAGLFKKSRQKTKAKDTELAESWRYDRLPAMSFHKGVLQNVGTDLWKLGTVTMQLAPGCRIEGGSSSLQTGRTAVVMGPRSGNTIIAWSIDMQRPQASVQPQRSPGTEIVWSEADPTVGEGHAPN